MQSALRDVELDDLRDVKIVLGSLLERLDPDAIPTGDADAMWEFFSRITRLGSAGATLMARRVDDSEQWRRERARSAAEHMSRLAGTSVSEASRMLQTSKRVQKLPKTAAAMRSGVLSPGKAEAIADAATVVPEAEDDLLDGAADKTLSDVREECLKAKAKSDPEDRHKRIHRERHLRQHTDREGAWRFHGRATVDAQAEFKAAHEPILDEIFKAARANGEHEPRKAYALDALIEMARRANGQHTAEPSDKNPKRPAAKYTGIIRIDFEALQRGWIEGEETCEIRGLAPIPVSVARGLLGDAVLKLVITKGVDVINVTHLGRSATVAQQVALWWRSPTCTNLHCNRTQFLENDHRREWHKCHETRADNLDPLCGHDHDLKTNHGWALVDGIGKRPLVPPDDPRHPKNKPKE